MEYVKATQASSFAPVGAAAHAAASAYLERAEAWQSKSQQANKELSAFLKAHVPQKALGVVSQDPLGMMPFSVLFQDAPGQGFIAVPRGVADQVMDTGLRGTAYMPDTKTELGKQVARLLARVGKTAEERPLLGAIEGVKLGAIENNRLVLSTVARQEGQIVVKAASSAVSPSASVRPIHVTPMTAPEPNVTTTSARKPRLH